MSQGKPKVVITWVDYLTLSPKELAKKLKQTKLKPQVHFCYNSYIIKK